MTELNCAYCDQDGICRLYSTMFVAVPCVKGPCKDYVEGDRIARTKLKIIEVNPDFRQAVEANEGYCPCMVERSADTKCMCREFRDQKEPGLCHCGRFEKVVENHEGS